MKILITGVAGFVGVNFAKFMLEKNHEVIGVDNFLTGKKNHIELLRNFINFEFLEIDCRNLNELNLIGDRSIDVVFHFAANSQISAAINDPLIDINHGVLTTISVLEHMRKYQIRRIFFSSGSGVYGDKPGVLLSETGFTGEPTSTYGATKIASEALISSYANMYGIKGTVMRFGNLVGPYMTHGVIFDLDKKLSQNPDELEVLGNGLQSKPFIHITDAVNAVLKIAEVQEKKFDIFNISVPDNIEVRRVVTLLVESRKLNPKIKYGDSERGWQADIPKYELDISKLLLTGWKPNYNSEAAVAQAIKECINTNDG